MGKNSEKRTDVATRVRQIIADQLCWDLTRVTRKARFLDDLGADSLDQVEILIELESEYDIEIHDDDADKVLSETATVQDVITYVENRMKSETVAR